MFGTYFVFFPLLNPNPFWEYDGICLFFLLGALRISSYFSTDFHETQFYVTSLRSHVDRISRHTESHFLWSFRKSQITCLPRSPNLGVEKTIIISCWLVLICSHPFCRCNPLKKMLNLVQIHVVKPVINHPHMIGLL